MEEHNLDNWEQFENAVQKLEYDCNERKKVATLKISDLLFRGQANSAWLLETTLER